MQDRMSKIPEKIRGEFDSASTDLQWAYGRWILHGQLFRHSERRIDFLNEVASTCFYMLEVTLFDDVILSISRLTDPAKSGENARLSLVSIQALLDKNGKRSLAEECKLHLDSLIKNCKPIRNMRDSTIAHTNRDMALGLSKTRHSSVTQALVTSSLDSIGEYFNLIQRHYDESETGYRDFILSSDGEQLMATLRGGVRYEELLQSRKIEYDDERESAWYGV